MKSIFLFALVTVVSMSAISQGDKPKVIPSPPAHTSYTSPSGLTITIDYSQPSVKGRTIGKDLEPLPGKVWRTGANAATVFEVNKDVKVEGKALPAGKYGLFTIANGNDWTIIFSKNSKQWGAFSYKESEDALRVNVKAGKATAFAEKFIINATAEKITLLWGDSEVSFKVE